MEKLAEKIALVFHDYHSYRGYTFNAPHVIKWVNQFDENDRTFILEEFLHILGNGIYIDEAKGKEILIKNIEKLASHYKFRDITAFLKNVEFLRTQPVDKSQDILLKILDNELRTNIGLGIKDCGINSKKYVIYVDDILATGGTVYNDCFRWLKEVSDNGETNFNRIISEEKYLAISLFCIHNKSKIDWRLKLAFSNDSILKKITYQYHYEIENHANFLNQKLNLAYPTIEQPQSVFDYLNSLSATNKGETAFRKNNTPQKEIFFSSPENRVRLENIFLQMGIKLLSEAANLKPNHRPLGMTTPSHRTLGTGTMFFTWRNISNTTPIVFWWEVRVASNWYPLFPLYHRGM